MMMPAVRVSVAGVGHAHVAQAKTAPESAFDDGAVLRPHEIKQCILRRGLSLGGCGEWQASECHRQNDPLHDLHNCLFTLPREKVRREIRGWDSARWYHSCRDLMSGRSSDPSARNRN